MFAKRRIHFSLQLFLYISPLIILPILIVAVLGYKISASGMTSISRDKLSTEAKGSAASIDVVFNTCEKDLETLWMYFFAEAFDVAQPRKFSDNLMKLIPVLNSFKNSFPMYLQVGFWNSAGELVVSSDFGIEVGDFLSEQERRLVMYIAQRGESGPPVRNHPVSPVLFSDRHRNYVVTVGKAVYNPDGEILGCLMIDLDFLQIVDLIKHMDSDFNSSGFAFLVDLNGNTIYHPDYEPYTSSFTHSDDAMMREFIINTALGRAGFRVYVPQGATDRHMAAYAPVKTVGWTVVKTMPLSEFTQAAATLRDYILQIGLLTIIAAVFVLWYLAYRLNLPILKLANATRQLSSGNLDVDLVPIIRGSSYESMELTNDFNYMARNLRRIQAELVAAEKMAALGRLSAGVAHELRNPLNAIRLTITYMERHRNDTDLFNEASEALYQEIERLNKFVNDFLYFAKEAPPVKEPADVGALVRKIVILNQEQADASGIEVSLAIEEGLPQVPLDKYQIMQVLFNLYNNALQAMPLGGHLDISVGISTNIHGKRGVIIAFADSGSGVDETVINNIFEPFFTTKESGTGLGLAMSLAIIEAHGGMLTLNNQIVGGVRAEIFLALDD